MNDIVLWFIIAFIVVIVTLGVLACIWKYVKSIFFDILFSIIIIGIAIVIYYPIKNAIYNNGFTSTDVVFQSDILTEEDTQYFVSPAKSTAQVAYLDEEHKVQYVESDNLKIFY